MGLALMPFCGKNTTFRGVWIFGLLFDKSAGFGADLDVALKCVCLHNDLTRRYYKIIDFSNPMTPQLVCKRRMSTEKHVFYIRFLCDTMATDRLYKTCNNDANVYPVHLGHLRWLLWSNFIRCFMLGEGLCSGLLGRLKLGGFWADFGHGLGGKPCKASGNHDLTTSGQMAAISDFHWCTHPYISFINIDQTAPTYCISDACAIRGCVI